MAIPESFEEHFSILYFGPQSSGVQNSFQKLYQILPEQGKGEWEFQERGETSFWLENFADTNTQFQLLYVPHPFPPDFPLEMILPRVSGIVFVADGDPQGMEENQKALESLTTNLNQFGIEQGDICWLFQYNQEPLEDSKLNSTLNPQGNPSLIATEPKDFVEGLTQITQLVRETAKTIEDQILHGLLPESSVEIVPAFDPGKFPLISQEEGLKRLKEKGVLEGVAMEELDLSSTIFSQPLLIRSCKIGSWKSLGTVFEEKVEIREVIFTREICFSSSENPARVEKDLILAHSSLGGEANFSGLVALSSVRLLHVEAKRGLCSFNRAILHANLELTDSSFKKGDFRNILVEGQLRADPVYFSSTTNFKKARFLGGATFTSSTFEGIARFRETRFKKLADFSGADFQDEAYFGDSSFQSVEFLKTCFGGPANFLRVDFQGLARFRRVRFEADSVWTGLRASQPFLLEDVEFIHTANFQEALFAKLELQNVKFRSDGDFSSSIFEGSVSFHETQFEGDGYFLYCQFQSRVDFKGAVFHKGISFIGMEGNLVVIKRSQVEDHLIAVREKSWKEASWEYKRLKKIFEDLQAFGDAEWAYYNLKVAQRKALDLSFYRPDRWIRSFVEWLFLDLGTRYGTRPVSLIWAALSLILIFSLLYGLVLPDNFSHPSTAPMNVGSGLVLSCSVFATNGTMGWQVFPFSPAAYLIALESVLGLFLILLFAVTFMRKMLH